MFSSFQKGHGALMFCSLLYNPWSLALARSFLGGNEGACGGMLACLFGVRVYTSCFIVAFVEKCIQYDTWWTPKINKDHQKASETNLLRSRVHHGQNISHKENPQPFREFTGTPNVGPPLPRSTGMGFHNLRIMVCLCFSMGQCMAMHIQSRGLKNQREFNDVNCFKACRHTTQYRQS